MRNYKDLMVWEKAHKLTLSIYKETCAFPKEERFGLTSQVRRASSSIPANLAEGCGRRSDGEMGRFVQIAMGSGAELSYHLLLCRDLGILGATEFSRLSSDLEEVMRMLSALSQRVKGNARSGVSELRAKG
ncbi:MAG TPA: four helix bundle protein [Candidatus Dormibacteraeota bacterium]|nr:four helix bundle protein [Candidatus Dormibacteraeota bacterium]